MRRFRLGTGAGGLCGSTALFLMLACGSGQTGSPVSELPPEYETPGRKPPPAPGSGGNIDNGGSGSEPPEQVLPRPAPVPGSTALVGDRLLVAARGSLTLMDVATPTAPSELGRLPIEGDTDLLEARSLHRVIVSTYAAPHGSSDRIPDVDVPFVQHELLHVDATNPAAPRLVRRDRVPEGSAGIVVRDGGYTALGGVFESTAVTCNAGTGAGLANIDLSLLPAQPKPVLGLWLQRFGADTPEGEARRDFGPGHWQLSSDQTHAIRVATPANEAVASELGLEVVSTSSLETVFQITLPAADLGTPLSLTPSADYAAGVLVVAAGPRLLGFDVATGQALAPISTPSAVQGLRFLDPATIGLDAAGSPLVGLDRSGPAPALSLVPVAGDQFVGSLQPWGEGYVALDGTGGGSTPQLLRASSYAIDGSGTLVLVDQLQTDWYFSTDWYFGTPWYIDSESARLSYALPVNDTESGRVGVIALRNGELVRSNLALVEQVSRAPLVLGDAVLAFGRGVLQPVRIDDGPSLELESLTPTTIALDGVWLELTHAGLIFARHRKDTGESFVSVRAGAFGEPHYLEVPHAVDSFLPVDEHHLAVLGLSVNGICDTRRESDPSDCGPNTGNGVTIIDIEGGEASVGTTIELSTLMAGPPPADVQRSLDWQGYLGVAPGKWALWSRFQDFCSSDASCAALGVPAHHSLGTRGCSTGQVCEPGTVELVSGYYNASWLFVLDLTNPDAPVLAPAVREGVELDIPDDEYSDLGRKLLGYTASNGSSIWGYPNQEFIANAEGNFVDDGHGGSLSAWYLQLMHGENGSVSFGERINVPGETVLLMSGGGASEHTAFTLEPRYEGDATEQHMALVRVRIADAGAFVEESLDVGPRLMSTQATEGLIALLSTPEELCADDANFELRVADARGMSLSLSQPLALPLPDSNVSWTFGGSPEPGVVELNGGPARFAGRLRVDVTTNPPTIVDYNY